MKKYIVILFSVVVFFGSCEDFLEEKMVATITQDYFDTEQDLDQLIANTYNTLRFKYGWIDGAYNFEIGTDIGWVGNWDVSSFSGNQWRASGTGNENMGQRVNDLLGIYPSSQMLGAYPGINDCNRAIEAISEGKALGIYATDVDYAAARLAEANFNRAWWYYMLTTQLGDVYMTLKSNNTVPTHYNFPKSSLKEVYTQIIKDVRYRWEKLPETAVGRHTKYTAAHFLAKLYLQRAQSAQFENSSFPHLKMLFKGSVSTDLDSAIYFATQVIESGKYQLEPDYWSLFDVKLGDWSNEKSSEIIMAAGYGDNSGHNGRYGMRSQGYFTASYVILTRKRNTH